MNELKKTGRIVGIIFLIMFIPGFLSMNMRGLGGSLITSPDWFSLLNEAAVSMKWAIVFDLLATFMGLIAGIFLFPVLERFHKGLALGYVGLWLFQLALAAVGNVGHLSLIALSDYLAGGVSADPALYFPSAYLMYETYYFAHFMTLIFFSIGAGLLYYMLLRLRLIPVLLGVWGLATVGIVFTATWLQIFDQEVSLLLYLQNGFYLLVLSLWLIIRGFQAPDDRGGTWG